MRIEPAHIDQIHAGADGRVVVIEADVGNVAADLRGIDPCLRLRYSEGGGHFVVYRVHRDGQPCRDDDPERTEELVLTARECDQRIVHRVRMIDSQGRGGYDFLKEVEKQTVGAYWDRRERFREKVRPLAEQAAHAARKDLGTKNRAFIKEKP